MLTDQQRDELLSNRPAETVTMEGIKSKAIAHAFWHPYDNSTLTICVITLSNGFEVVGQSACANKANFDADLGKKLAYDDALNKVWMLEGYLLREALHLQSQADTTGAQQAEAILSAPADEPVEVDYAAGETVDVSDLPAQASDVAHSETPAHTHELPEGNVENSTSPQETTGENTEQVAVELEAPLSQPVQQAPVENPQPSQEGVQVQQQGAQQASN